MGKLFEFFRRSWFLVRVISGYEERRIRSYRLELQKRIAQAQIRKAELRRLPEQTILSEVRRMVEEMQGLNRQIEETESKIEAYFKPIDKSAEIIMNSQLEKEENQMREMMKVMHEQSMLQRSEAMKLPASSNVDEAQPAQPVDSTVSQHEQPK